MSLPDSLILPRNPNSELFLTLQLDQLWPQTVVPSINATSPAYHSCNY